MKKPLKILIAIVFALLLCGCWDGTQLDSRGFVTAMSIDTNSEGNYLVSLEMPKVSKDTSDMEKSVKSNSHRSLNKAVYGVDIYTDNKVFMGHMKIALCGEELLRDREMFKHTLDTLIRDRGISRTLLLLAVEGEGTDIIEADTEDESLIGVYISNFFKKKNLTTFYRQTLDNLTKFFAEGETVIIPRVEAKEEGLEFSGAAVMRDYVLAGWLSEDELRGLMWLSGKAGHHEININDEDDYFSINIDKYKSDLTFFEVDGEVYAVISIKLEGEAEEVSSAVDTDTDLLIQKAKQSIEADINKAYEALYINMGVDGFNMERTLEKKSPNLYRAYIESKSKSVMDIIVLLGIDVGINSKGAVE